RSPRSARALGALRDRFGAARGRGPARIAPCPDIQQAFPQPQRRLTMAEAASTGKSGKVVIRNIGLMLSGDIDRPILDADTIVVNDGLIVAVGREADCDTSQPDTLIDARATCVCPGLIDSHVH